MSPRQTAGSPRETTTADGSRHGWALLLMRHLWTVNPSGQVQNVQRAALRSGRIPVPEGTPTAVFSAAVSGVGVHGRRPVQHVAAQVPQAGRGDFAARDRESRSGSGP